MENVIDVSFSLNVSSKKIDGESRVLDPLLHCAFGIGVSQKHG
jgi:hypothetical protein